MTTKSKSILVIAAIAVVGAIASIAMYTTHSTTRGVAPIKAQTVNDDEMTNALRRLPVTNLVVRTVGDITVLRGDARDTDTIEKAGQIIRDFGVRRIANLIHVPTAPDDLAIRIDAERKLAQSRALDGCTFAVSCNRGVLKVNGRVQSDLQADAARSLMNSVQGTQRVEMAFAR